MAGATAEAGDGRGLFWAGYFLIAALALIGCERDYQNPFNPDSPGYVGKEWSRDKDHDGISDSVNVYSPMCAASPFECLAKAKRASDSIRAMRESIRASLGADVYVDAADLFLSLADAPGLPDIAWSPDTIADKSYRLISGNPEVARVEGERIRPIAAGTASIILITDSYRLLDSFQVHVRLPDSVPGDNAAHVQAVTAGDMELRVGDADTLPLIFWFPAEARDKRYTLSSENPLVASVQAGKVHAVTPGTVGMIVTALDGGAADTIKVLVNPARVRLDSLRAENMILAIGTDTLPKLRWYPPDAENRDYDLEISAPAKALAEGMRFRALAPGLVTITVLPKATGLPGAEPVRFIVDIRSALDSLYIPSLGLTLGFPALKPAFTRYPGNAYATGYRLVSLNPGAVEVVRDSLVHALRGNDSSLVIFTDMASGRKESFMVYTHYHPVDSIAVDNMLLGTRDTNTTPSITWYPKENVDPTYTLGLAPGATSPAAIPVGSLVKPQHAGTQVLLVWPTGHPEKVKTSTVTVITSVDSLHAAPMRLVQAGPDTVPTLFWYPSDAFNRSYAMVSENPYVAVIQNGKIKPLAPGIALIEITCEDGGQKAFAEVEVLP